MQKSLNYRLIEAGRWILLSLCGVLLISGWITYNRGLPSSPHYTHEEDIIPSAWPELRKPSTHKWTTVFERHPGYSTEHLGPLAGQYRLAGTFFAYPDDLSTDTHSSRQAILDDIKNKRQHLVREGDELDKVQVVSIFRDRIVLRGKAGQEELWLSFKKTAADIEVDQELAEEPQPLRFEDMEALETSRFGKRIGENRWVFQRESLIDYMEEVQENPERLAALFLAMQPDIRDGEVAGYELRPQGENILYEAAGMKEGDIVRMLNPMPMTSPARAEYFISEFLNERISAIVFDIERDGEEDKLIYLLR